MSGRRLLVGAAALLGALCPAPAGAEPRFVPMVGAELGQSHERLSVKLPGYSAHEDRWLWNISMNLGLSAALPPLSGLALRTDTTVGYGKVIHTGHGRLSVRQDALASVPLGAGFSLLGGPGLGLAVDTTSCARSALELALPLGLRYRAVELLYRPAVALPLGAEGRPVFGGSRELATRPGLVPFGLLLRVRLQGLGF